MAQVPYNEGVPTEEPQTSVPDDYQQIQPRAAEGLATFGEGLSKAGQFFGQVAADDQTNAVLKGASRIMYGDPGVTAPADTGYLGKTGANALNARPQVEKQIDDLISAARGNLSTPEQQLQFDSFTRRYRISLSEQIGSHADREAKTWYGTVNTDSENNAQDAVARDPYNTETVKHAIADTTNALVKQAQIEGADPKNPNDPLIKNALILGLRKTLNTQIKAIGAADPAGALRILQKNRQSVGTDYDNLYADLSNRAAEQEGTEAGTGILSGHNAAATAHAATSLANPTQPVYRQAATDIPGGMSPTGIARTVQIESGGRADVVNASGHVGLGQFSAATWRAFGGGGDPKNPQDAIVAIQRYAASNARYLTPILGRPPTDAELYLAHQQGPAGAARLLSNPNALASSIVGVKAVVQNGGTADMTAGQYASMWTHRFNGTTPAGAPMAAATAAIGGPVGMPATAPVAPTGAGVAAAPAAPSASPLPDETPQPMSAKASAYQAIEDLNLSPKAKQYAYETINRGLAAQQIAADATATQIRQQSDQAAGTYMTQLLSGGSTPDLLQKIAQDPKLTWETKESLTRAAEGHAENTAAGATAAYGPGFWPAYQQVSAPAGDPSRISDVAAILRRAGPGGDLTLAGAQKLVSVMGENTRSMDSASVNDTKLHLMDYARSKISFDTSGQPSIPGEAQKRDAEGERLFNSRFVPKFEAAYDRWIKDGKDPYQFLTKENVDKLADGIRSPRERAMAELLSEATGVDLSQLAAPPAPAGADPEGWKLAVMTPPLQKSGQPWPVPNWAAVLTMLKDHPTKDVMRQFDEKFGPSGTSAKDMLDVLGVAPQDAQPPDERGSPAAAPPADEPDVPVVPSAPIVRGPPAEMPKWPTGIR